MHVNHAVRGDAEFLEHLVRADELVFHRVQHADTIADQLHQVLVRTDDCHLTTGLAGAASKGGNDVIGLEPFGFDTGDVEGAGGIAGQRKLRPQVFGQFGAVGLVLRIDLVAEGFGGVIEDHRDMGRRVARLVAFEIAEQDVAEAGRTDRQPVGFAGQRWQGMIGAKDVGRAVDQVQVVAFAESRGHFILLLCSCVGGISSHVPA